MTHGMSRREFVHRGALLAVAVHTRPWPRWRAPIALRIGIAAASSAAHASTDRQSGIDLGIDEARHAARLFGGAIEAIPLATPTAHDSKLSAIVGAGDVDACSAWAEHAREVHVVFMNVSCTSDAFRGASCGPTVFHIVPSDAMYKDAASGRGASVVAWDASLSRFGAETLNQRFRARFGRPMTTDAWAAWLAIKILWESSLRAKTDDAGELAAYMARESTQFDGHKGQPLSFRAWDHQLRQPVYILGDANGERLIRDVPEVAATESPRDALDRLGAGPSQSICQLAR
jgi:hypothetical protein